MASYPHISLSKEVKKGPDKVLFSEASKLGISLKRGGTLAKLPLLGFHFNVGLLLHRMARLW